jgi:hypothetical protein
VEVLELLPALASLKKARMERRRWWFDSAVQVGSTVTMAATERVRRRRYGLGRVFGRGPEMVGGGMVSCPNHYL